MARGSVDANANVVTPNATSEACMHLLHSGCGPLSLLLIGQRSCAMGVRTVCDVASLLLEPRFKQGDVTLETKTQGPLSRP